MNESRFLSRDIFEKMYGRYIVVIDGDFYERFCSYDDAVQYQKACLAAGSSAIILDDYNENQLLE